MRVMELVHAIIVGMILSTLLSVASIASDTVKPWAVLDWTYCTSFETLASDWSVHTPSASAFEIAPVSEGLCFRGEAVQPEFAPQIMLREHLQPMMSGVFEVVAVVTIEELGAIFALDVNDEESVYDWSLDVSLYEVSFGYEDATGGQSSGWTLWQRLDPEMWSQDAALGEHALRIVFEAGQASAYIDHMHVASFPLPADLDRGIVRLSVDQPPMAGPLLELV